MNLNQKKTKIVTKRKRRKKNKSWEVGKIKFDKKKKKSILIKIIIKWKQ